FKIYVEKEYQISLETQEKEIDSATGIAHKDDDITHETGNNIVIETGNFIHLFLSKKITEIIKPDFNLEAELIAFKKTYTESSGINMKTIQRMIENIRQNNDFMTIIQSGKQLCEKNIIDIEDRKVQGYIDLVLIGEKQIAVLDYKTYLNKFPDEDTLKKYRDQVNIYTKALSKIYHDKVVKKYLFFIGKEKAELNLIS
ncbi:MAG: PD-(D/E)XK nuclease family protein, partial [Candidatus Delongbacteria bacterium]|nr:PD-(D/E)XK nuclease family protein [Candidatus Delongbacteria bacterium]